MMNQNLSYCVACKTAHAAPVAVVINDHCPQPDSQALSDQYGRVPVETFDVGDRVRAVKEGPVGTVTDANRAGWTIVEYAKSSMPYKHGHDRLIAHDGLGAAIRAATRGREEIDRLRVEKDAIYAEMTELRVEVEALRKRTCLCAFRGKDHGPVFPSVSDLQDENERLREALTYIADEANMVRWAPVSGERYIDTGYAARHAKAALSSDETNAPKETPDA